MWRVPTYKVELGIYFTTTCRLRSSGRRRRATWLTLRHIHTANAHNKSFLDIPRRLLPAVLVRYAFYCHRCYPDVSLHSGLRMTPCRFDIATYEKCVRGRVSLIPLMAIHSWTALSSLIWHCWRSLRSSSLLATRLSVRARSLTLKLGIGGSSRLLERLAAYGYGFRRQTQVLLALMPISIPLRRLRALLRLLVLPFLYLPSYPRHRPFLLLLRVREDGVSRAGV